MLGINSFLLCWVLMLSWAVETCSAACASTHCRGLCWTGQHTVRRGLTVQ